MNQNIHQSRIPRELMFPGWEDVAAAYFRVEVHNAKRIAAYMNRGETVMDEGLLIALYEAHPHKASKL